MSILGGDLRTHHGIIAPPAGTLFQFNNQELLQHTKFDYNNQELLLTQISTMVYFAHMQFQNHNYVRGNQYTDVCVQLQNRVSFPP